MTGHEIAELFIRAAFIDSRLPDTASPKRVKGSWVPFFHTEEDVEGRKRTNISFGANKEHLHPDDGFVEEWITQWWEEERLRLKKEDIEAWERANDLIVLVSNVDNRKALWAWAKGKVNLLEANEKKTRIASKKMGRLKLNQHMRVRKQVSFAAWCRSQGIHEMTGTRRKDRAIAIISQQLVRAGLPNVSEDHFPMLPVGPVLEHISDMIGAGSVSEEGLRSTMDETAFSPIGVLEARDFSWAQARNELRRQREERRRQKQAA